jgi:O-antigen/teichoic acid export membrane protein
MLHWFISPSFASAADLVPVICLAYFFYSLHTHFSVPVLVSKRTRLLLPASVAGALVNVAANIVLIPALGLAGAAWASVATFVVFSFVGLTVYRRLDRIEYPFARCGLVLIGVMATVALAGWAQGRRPYTLMSAFLSVAIWILWGLVLFGPLIFEMLERLKSRARLGLPEVNLWPERLASVTSSTAHRGSHPPSVVPFALSDPERESPVQPRPIGSHGPTEPQSL